MKKSILMLIAAAMVSFAFAGSVSPDMALAAANAWAAKNAAFGAGASATGEVRSVCDPDRADIVLWHQVSMQGGGMLVVAPVTEIEPVVMALDNDPGELPAAHPLRGILMGDMRRRLKFLGLYSAAPSGGASLQSVAPPAPGSGISEEARAWGEACNAKWAKLTGASFQEAAGVGVLDITVDVCTVKGFEKGGALTHWNQGSYKGSPLYNYYTPGHAVCGCVATACATLCQFYGTTNAVKLSNECSYQGVKDTYTTKPGAIDWAILPENWGGTNAPSETLSNAQQELIGRVAFNAGVGHGMMWTAQASGAYTSDMADVLKDVFGFRNARSVSLGDDASQYEKIIYNQCRAGVPVGMGIDGHAVVACGYGLDADGVERVRVFMGWAGRGDGWYALPKIDTKATMNGGTYLSESVSCAITMVSYDDDDVVPVVGHVAMPGANLEIPALSRTIESDSYGYFGTRVPANLGAGDCRITCLGKEAEFAIGAEAADSDDATALCDALPDVLEVSLLNSTVAYSLARAKELALAEGKAILRVSGTSSETNTARILDYIYSLDKDNVNDFTNRFVYYYTTHSSKDGDGNPSYGVLLPQVVDEDGRWQIANGALTYGFSQNQVTNKYVETESGTLEVVKDGTNVVTFTAAPASAGGTYMVNDAGKDEVTWTNISNSLTQVINVGWTEYVGRTSGIELTVALDDPKAESWVKITPSIGSHTSGFADGQQVECRADGLSTNETAGVVLGIGAWSLTNAETGDLLQEGTGTNFTFEVAGNTKYKLTCSVVTNAVRISMECACTSCGAERLDCSVTPEGTAWYPYGKGFLFTANHTDQHYLSGWSVMTSGTLAGHGCRDMGNALWCPATEPLALQATFRDGSTPSVSNFASVTVASYEAMWTEVSGGEPTLTISDLLSDSGVVPPVTSVVGVPGFEATIADGGTNDVPAVSKLGLVPERNLFRDQTATPTNWVCVGWCRLADLESGAGDIDVYLEPAAALNLQSADQAGIAWLWMRTAEAPTEEDEPLPELVIDWNEGLDNLENGYSTNLLTKAQFERSGLTLEALEAEISCPTGWVAHAAQNAAGDVVVTLALNETALAPVAAPEAAAPIVIVPNGDGTVTVRAHIANGLKGFWYSIFSADALDGIWARVASGKYVPGEGVPTEQATLTGPITVKIVVNPGDTRKFYKLVVTDKEPEAPAI